MNKKEHIKKWAIALTGGIASGKSFVASYLKSENFHVYDADQLSFEASKKGSKAYFEIIDFFGKSILDEKKEINRKRLGGIVFEDEDKRKILETILHPRIEEALIDKLEKDDLFNEPKVWFYEAALIFEKRKQSFFKETWLCYCSKETQILRLEKRGLKDKNLINKIIDSQMNYEEKMKESDFLIKTDLTKDEVLRRVRVRLKL